MKARLLVVFVCITLSSVFSQEDADIYSKLYIKPAIGINLPITNLLQGEVTDDLFKYSDNSFYYQILSGNFFFSKHWGIEFTYQAGYSNSISGRADRFQNKMQKMYGKDYFVSTESGAQYNGVNPILGDIERGYLGLVYRIEGNKFILLPKLLLGIVSFSTDWATIDLKEKGTNNVLKISYDSGRRPNDYFTIVPAVTFGYRLSERIIANVDILYSYYKTNIEFIEKTRNTFTEEISNKTIDYKKNVNTLTIGIGLIIEFAPIY